MSDDLSLNSIRVPLSIDYKGTYLDILKSIMDDLDPVQYKKRDYFYKNCLHISPSDSEEMVKCANTPAYVLPYLAWRIESLTPCKQSGTVDTPAYLIDLEPYLDLSSGVWTLIDLERVAQVMARWNLRPGTLTECYFLNSKYPWIIKSIFALGSYIVDENCVWVAKQYVEPEGEFLSMTSISFEDQYYFKPETIRYRFTTEKEEIEEREKEVREFWFLALPK